MHWEQAEHNEMMALDIVTQNPIKYKDWAGTASFYSAVHYVEAYMDKIHGKHADKDKPDNMSPHKYRESMVRRNLPEVISDYKELLRVSKMLRYLLNEDGSCVKTTKGDYISEKDLENLFHSNLQNIKTATSVFLGYKVTRY